MEQIIIALIGTFGTVLSGLLIFLTRQVRKGHAMSEEERDLLIEIKSDISHIKKTLQQEREDRLDLTDRFNQHVAIHR